MATFTYVIPYRKADGTANVRIRVTHLRKKKEFTTNIILQKEDFTRNGKIKNYAVLDELEDMISSYRKKCVKLGLRINRLSVDEVAEYITKEDCDNFTLDFFTFGENYAAGKKPNTRQAVTVALHCLKSFVGKDALDINDIDTRLLQNFVNDTSKRLANNSILGYIRKLKTVFLAACNEYNDDDAVLIRKDPFKKLHLPKQMETKKRAVDTCVIKKIAELESIPDYGKYMYSSYNIAKDLFTLSFMLVGMNAVDLYHCPPIDDDGYITYNRTKTKDRRSDMAEIRIKVPYCAMRIIDRYRDTDGTHMLILHKHYSNARHLNVILSNGMRKVCKEIGVKATFYSARHSWATIAVNDCGIDKYTVHLALNHTDPSTAITDVYIKKDFTVIDKANERVLDFVKLL